MSQYRCMNPLCPNPRWSWNTPWPDRRMQSGLLLLRRPLPSLLLPPLVNITGKRGFLLPRGGESRLEAARCAARLTLPAIQLGTVLFRASLRLLCCYGGGGGESRRSIDQVPNEECWVWFESQNLSFIQTEQAPDGSISEIIAGVAESVLLDNKNLRENALFCSIKWNPSILIGRIILYHVFALLIEILLYSRVTFNILGPP